MAGVEVERLVEAALGPVEIAEGLVEHSHQEEELRRRRKRHPVPRAEFESLEMPASVGESPRLLEQFLEGRCRCGRGRRRGRHRRGRGRWPQALPGRPEARTRGPNRRLGRRWCRRQMNAAPQGKQRGRTGWNPVSLENWRFGGAEHEDAVGAEKPVERPLHPAPGFHRQVDQQVAAEDHVVGAALGGELVVAQVCPGEPHAGQDPLIEHRGRSLGAEPALAEGAVGVAKGVGGVAAPGGPLERHPTDVDRVDHELPGCEPRVEESHRHGVGLLAGRAGRTQDPDG